MSEYTQRNIGCLGVMHVSNQAYLFVHEDHPIIPTITTNVKMLNTQWPIGADDSRGKWFKVDVDAFNAFVTRWKTSANSVMLV